VAIHAQEGGGPRPGVYDVGTGLVTTIVDAKARK
jgi:hypothetical protein